MQELGPFRVNSDNKTLNRNKKAWNNGKLYLPFFCLLSWKFIDYLYVFELKLLIW